MDINEQSYHLAQYYYQYSQTQIPICQSTQNLKEYYTLVKLSLSLLFKITTSSQKTSLALKLKAYLLISKIIQNEAIDQNYQQYLDQILMMTQNTLNDPMHFYFNLQAKFLLCKSYETTPSNYKQTMNIVNSHEQLLVFKYLKFEILDKVSKGQALEYLQSTLLPSLPVDSSFKNLVDYIKLLEIHYCLQNNLPLSIDIRTVQPNDLQLTSIKYILEVLYFIQYSPEFTGEGSTSLEDVLRKLASFLMQNEKSLNSSSIEVRFPFLQGQDFIISVGWLNYNELNIMFSFLYGISVLNKSFEKRKALALFQNAKKLIAHELNKFNQFSSEIKSSRSKIHQLKEWNQTCEFYLLLENIIVDELSPEKFRKSTFNISNPCLVLYLTAFYNQSNGDLKQALSQYDIIFNHYNTAQNQEIFLYSLFNSYLILEGQQSYFKRLELKPTTELVELSNRKNQVLSSILQLTQGSDKFMVNLTRELLNLINNPDNLSILELNNRVSIILRTSEQQNAAASNTHSTFERFKKTPQLLAILLYLNSSTLNSNSDERQKTSQIAFNLSKYGNFKFLRYICGALNLKNAEFANNFAQVNIQAAKLEKIEAKLLGRSNDFTEATQ